MKKIINIMLMIAMLLCNVAFAEEEFTLRKGIMFGDTMDIILQKETSLTRKSETSNAFTGKIAGYSDATCEFAFDDNGGLKSMLYVFDCFSRDATDNTYDTLYDSLVRQYGKAEGNTGGSCELITGPAIDDMILWVYLFGELDGCSADYYDYDEWIIECTNYNVKIDLVSYYYRNDDFEYTYKVEASYLKYTDEEYDAEINKKQNERDEVDDDL